MPVENSVQNVHRRLWRTPRDDDATKTNGCSNVAWSSFDDFMFSRCFDVLLRMILHFVLFSANWSMTIINTKIIKICPHLLMLSSKYYGPFTRRWQTSIVIVFQGSVAASTRRGAWRIKHISWFRFRDHILRRALVTPQVILIIEPSGVFRISERGGGRPRRGSSAEAPSPEKFWIFELQIARFVAFWSYFTATIGV